MVLLFESSFIEIILAILVILTIAIISYYKWAFTYWKNKNIPYLPPSIPFGNMENPFTNVFYVGCLFKEEYDYSKALGYKHIGIYLLTVPWYFAIDIAIAKKILQKDFNHFTERGFYYNEKDDPLSANLFALGGEKWRTIRTKLSPAFTSVKLKMMLETLLQCGYQLREAIDNIYEDKKEIDVKDISACFSIDVIGSCAFGLECNCFKNPNSEFKRVGKKVFDFNSRLRRAKIAFAFGLPNLARLLRVKLFDDESIEFFVNIVRETVKYRQTNKVVRNDMIQLLIDSKESKASNNENNENPLEKDSVLKELAAEVFIFFAAGFETSSTTLSFCLYELAVNSDIQSKVREEINSILDKHEGKVTYDSIMDMKYLTQVVEETLRKYPPVTFLTRQCVKDYKIPGTEVTLDKGRDVVISILGIHHDADYYPEPEKFDPDRFSEENKRKRLPFTYLPFGEGPRICIGLRFGLMQIKVALTLLLQHYKFLLNKKTVEPIEFEPYSFTLVPRTGIFLNMEKIVFTVSK